MLFRSATGSLWESAPPSPTFDAAASIHIPQTGDAAMQQFFHDIVGQLQTISLRNSLPPSPVSSPTPTFRTSFAESAPSPTPYNVDGDPTQFEDAEEDDEDPYGEPASANYVYQPVQPLVINKPPPLVRPRLHLPPGARGSSRIESPILVGRANSRAGGYASRPVSEQRDKENVRWSQEPVKGRQPFGVVGSGSMVAFDADAVMVPIDSPDPGRSTQKKKRKRAFLFLLARFAGTDVGATQRCRLATRRPMLRRGTQSLRVRNRAGSLACSTGRRRSATRSSRLSRPRSRALRAGGCSRPSASLSSSRMPMESPSSSAALASCEVRSFLLGLRVAGADGDEHRCDGNDGPAQGGQVPRRVQRDEQRFVGAGDVLA